MALLQIHEPGQTPDPHENEIAIGIDLGTTHSVAAIMHDGVPKALHLPGENSIVPSVVTYSDAQNVAVGEQAAVGAHAVRSVKRLMGKSSSDDAVALQLGNVKKVPEEVSADILKHLKRIGEMALGDEIKKAVITVPAYFDDAARLATKRAAQLAGLGVLRLINEPTAAALAYGLDKQAEGVFAVYDLGGGTFDISILKLTDGVFQVLATAGDTELGGDDVDRKIASHALEKWQKTPDQLGAEAMKALVIEARAVKEQLSDNAQARLAFEGDTLDISQDDLREIAASLIQKTLDCSERALSDAALNKSDVNGVILVGGSTRMPLVKQAVATFFEQTPHDDLDPDRVVAYGAAIQAHALTQGADHLLLDVVPLSLGLETMGGMVEKIIHRNSPIPSAVAQEFTTYADGQTGLKLHVVQGEREMVADCMSLAQFELLGIPPMNAGAARIKVTFEVDADGLLTVSAQETVTGVMQQVEVKPSHGLSVDEMAQMLRDSMENATSDMATRMLAEKRVEAERAMRDLQAAMAHTPDLVKPGEENLFAAQLDRLSKAVSGSDRDKISYELAQLHVLIGPFAERRMNQAIQTGLEGQHVSQLASNE